jgi:hypothetical protein
MSDDRLSALQCKVLTALYERHRTQRVEGVWGVPWRIPRHSRAVAASLSRALARLEGRGLLLRQNSVSGFPGCDGTGRSHRVSASDPHNRTTHVVLLSAGFDLVERLTKEQVPNVNRPAGDGSSELAAETAQPKETERLTKKVGAEC